MRQPKSIYRSIVVDNHALFADGLKRILNSYNDIEVVGVFNDGETFLKSFEPLDPHIVFMDLEMKGINGFDATKKALLKNQNLRVIAVTFHNDGHIVKKALDSGMFGFVTKDSSSEELRHAFTQVISGNHFISPSAAQNYTVYSMLSKGSKTSISKNIFTERQLEIIKLISMGKSEKEMSTILNVGIKTIEGEKKKISMIMGVKKSPQIVSEAFKWKLIS